LAADMVKTWDMLGIKIAVFDRKERVKETKA
jgi:hypothetical protein